MLHMLPKTPMTSIALGMVVSVCCNLICIFFYEFTTANTNDNVCAFIYILDLDNRILNRILKVMRFLEVLSLKGETQST